MKIRLTLFAACGAVALALFMFPRAGSGSAPGGGPAPAAAAQAPLADLIVDSAALRQHWVVRDEYMAADRCSAIEGNITPGDRKIVRFTVSTPNVGEADLVVGDPNEHVTDGLFEFATCHNHHHFRNYAKYELVA